MTYACSKSSNGYKTLFDLTIYLIQNMRHSCDIAWRYAIGTVSMHRLKQAKGFRRISVKLQQKLTTYRIQEADDSQHVPSQ
jgi:hypothetical protein